MINLCLSLLVYAPANTQGHTREGQRGREEQADTVGERRSEQLEKGMGKAGYKGRGRER